MTSMEIAPKYSFAMKRLLQYYGERVVRERVLRKEAARLPTFEDKTLGKVIKFRPANRRKPKQQPLNQAA